MRLKIALVMGAAAALAATLVIGLAGKAHRSATSARLTADGWGAVRIGMTPRQVEGALHAHLTTDNSASGSDACVVGWVGPMNRPTLPVSFRFVDGTLAVIGLQDASLQTMKGVHIGDPESKVLAAYGSALKKEPAPYYGKADPQHQLYLWTASQRGLLFWIDGKGNVERIEAGTEAIKAMEGCA
jgi:hypothetical protein